MTKTFMFLAGAVLMLWFVGTCNTVPVISVGVGVTLGGTPYRQPRGDCLEWHEVGPGETQWAIATHYAGGAEKNQWLRRARKRSGLAVEDDDLMANQRLCVAW